MRAAAPALATLANRSWRGEYAEMLQKLLFVLVAAAAASASADAATLMSKVHKIVHRAGSMSPSKQAEKFLNSTFSPPGKTRLWRVRC